MRLVFRVFVCVLLGFTFLLSERALWAQTTFNTVVVFGDSLSDTGNIANLVENDPANLLKIRYPGDNTALGFNYTDGRFTDGKDTQPAAQAYFGVWVEQLAASFAGKPAVTNSLNGGTNFAFGDAVTGPGTTTLSEGPVSITLDNMGQQLTDYFNTNPKPNAQTLYVLWGGANDVYNAVSMATQGNQDPTAAAEAAATAAVTNEVGYIQQLAAAGATYFMVPNLPPLGSVPSAASSPGAAALNTGAAAFQQALAQGLATLKTGLAAKGINVTIYQPDIFTLFATVATNPMSVGLTDVGDKAQGISGDPDTYLIWDGEHPTTAGHHYAAAAAANLITPLTGSVTTLSLPSAILAAQVGTLTAKVTGSGSGTSFPTGSVTFFSGTTPIGAGPLGALGTVSIAPTGLAASSTPYNLTAVYAGDTSYNPSASAAQPLTVLGSAVSTSTALSAALTGVSGGQAADLTATVTPGVATYGTPAGTVTFYDGTTTLGTGTLNSSGVAVFTTATLTVGPHSFTATYGAAGVFASSTSTAVSQAVATPGFTAAANPTALTIKDGGTGVVQLSAAGTGGFSGALTLSCGTLPAHVTCSFSAATYTVPPPGSSVAIAPAVLTIGTTASSSAWRPEQRPGSWSAPEILTAGLMLPGFAGALLLGLRRRLRWAQALRLTAMIVLLSAGAVLGLSGCSSNPDATKGTYQIPVTFTPPSGSNLQPQTINVALTVD